MSDKRLIEKLKLDKLITRNFSKAIKGYHLIANEPIKEAVWEEINTQFFEKSKIKIYLTASGSHISGCDLKTEIGNLSNKTVKRDRLYCNLSSYRLSEKCNNEDVGNINEIIEEIRKRNSSFHYYSILIRNEELSVSSSSSKIPDKK